MSKKILIIEDDKNILELMALILEEEGYQIIAATDGKPLQNIHTINTDLVLLDDRLKDGNGADFCKSLKDNPLTATIPIILVSAISHIEEVARDCHADGYIAKPFDISEFINIVGKHIK